jgi:hypothetical protein
MCLAAARAPALEAVAHGDRLAERLAHECVHQAGALAADADVPHNNALAGRRRAGRAEGAGGNDVRCGRQACRRRRGNFQEIPPRERVIHGSLSHCLWSTALRGSRPARLNAIVPLRGRRSRTVFCRDSRRTVTEVFGRPEKHVISSESRRAGKKSRRGRCRCDAGTARFLDSAAKAASLEMTAPVRTGKPVTPSMA